MSVDDRHVNAPRVSLVMEITSGPETVSNSPGNRPELAKIVSDDDWQVNAPQGLTTMEIASGPQNRVIVHETGQHRQKP